METSEPWYFTTGESEGVKVTTRRGRLLQRLDGRRPLGRLVANAAIVCSRLRAIDDVGGVEEQLAGVVATPELLRVKAIESPCPRRSELPIRREDQPPSRRQRQNPIEEQPRAEGVGWRKFKEGTGVGVTRSFAQDVVREEGAVRIACELGISNVVEDAIESVEIRLKSRCGVAMRLAAGIADDCERSFRRRLGSSQANAKDLD